MTLGTGGGIPVIAIGHDGGEDVLALLIDLVQGLVASREVVLAGGGAVVTTLAGGRGLDGGTQPGQARLPGSGTDLPECRPARARASPRAWGGAAAICALSQTRVTRVQARVHGQGSDRRTAPIRCAIVRKYCW